VRVHSSVFAGAALNSPRKVTSKWDDPEEAQGLQCHRSRWHRSTPLPLWPATESGHAGSCGRADRKPGHPHIALKRKEHRAKALPEPPDPRIQAEPKPGLSSRAPPRRQARAASPSFMRAADRSILSLLILLLVPTAFAAIRNGEYGWWLVLISVFILNIFYPGEIRSRLLNPCAGSVSAHLSSL